jgi:tetratricopeptide (TPR) repeat protein
MSRIDALRELLAETPDDAFTRYALAMQLRQEDRLAEAMTEFRTLIERRPDYAASYLMAGQCAQDLGDRAEAVRIFRLGVEACARAGETHAGERCAEALADLEG